LQGASQGETSDQHEKEIEWEGFSPSSPDSPLIQEDDGPERTAKGSSVNVLYGVDATRLSSSHKKLLRPYSPFTKIVFNFPHVGGLSTDVNRQVRYNQELLVGFFNAAKDLLSSPTRPARIAVLGENDNDSDTAFSEGSQDPDHQNPGAVNGQILVTLFEGEPYTLWNIRDLARHCGLKVIESFKFPWSAYPGYQHARTTGDILSAKGKSDEGKREGVWRGEERDARCYVLEDQTGGSDVGRIRKKRKYIDKDDSD
jgi:25S rRNA (uracil2634-N3)-methyltransferase